MKYLVEYKDNYADEFDIEGAIIISKEEKELLDKAILTLQEECINVCFYFGSNEEIVCFFDEIGSPLSFKEIKDDEDSTEYGYAKEYLEVILYEYDNLIKGGSSNAAKNRKNKISKQRVIILETLKEKRISFKEEHKNWLNYKIILTDFGLDIYFDYTCNKFIFKGDRLYLKDSSSDFDVVLNIFIQENIDIPFSKSIILESEAEKQVNIVEESLNTEKKLFSNDIIIKKVLNSLDKSLILCDKYNFDKTYIKEQKSRLNKLAENFKQQEERKKLEEKQLFEEKFSKASKDDLYQIISKNKFLMDLFSKEL